MLIESLFVLAAAGDNPRQCYYKPHEWRTGACTYSLKFDPSSRGPNLEQFQTHLATVYEIARAPMLVNTPFWAP